MKLFDYALFGNVILNYLITFFLYKPNIIRYGIKYIIRIWFNIIILYLLFT